MWFFFFLNFVFFSPPPKTLSLCPAYTQACLGKTLEFAKQCRGERNSLCILAFSFPRDLNMSQ